MEQNNQTPPEKEHKLLEFREDEEKKGGLSDKAKKEIREWITSLAVAIVVVLLVRAFLFTIIRVQGPSMESTLFNGDRLAVTVLDMKLNGPARFDAVILHYPDYPANKNQYVKRVVGLPGETLEIRSGALYINGEAVEEPFLDPDCTIRYSMSDFGPVEIGEGEYFVMGDNRDNSNDSRAVGPISRDLFIGKVRHIIWPFNRLGGVPGSEVYGQ